MSEPVFLRTVRTSDYPLMFEWVNNRELRLMSSAFTPVSWEDHLRWIDDVQRDDTRKLFIITSEPEEAPIGQAVIFNISPTHMSCEFSIRIGSERHRDRGLGTRAVNLIISHVWKEMLFHRISLTVFRHNQRAIRVYEKCGFEVEGILRDAALVDGRWIDLVLMAILNPDRQG